MARRYLFFASLSLAAFVGARPVAAEVRTGAPGSFVAAQGRRSAVFGYSAQGLEVWAYPLQVLSDYRLRFREASRTTPLDGDALLSRVEVGPEETVRVYVGPDFVVRERLSAAPDTPAIRIAYDVQGRPDVQVEVRFRPSLNLMWPGAVGGQDVGWDAQRKGYVEREALHGFSAVIASPEAVAHDAVGNAAVVGDGTRGLVLQPRPSAPGEAYASLTIAADIKDPPAEAAPGLPHGQTVSLTTEPAGADDRDELRLTTPDPAFDAAVRDAEQALDAAWVCSPGIGCGEVAGYGPSRPERRPQYDWFFAGDGLVAADALLASGRYGRARDEIAFVTRFQNPANGMIWHEMSLSAPYIDWARYPYMYVHVDITLQYLATLARYEDTTGDRAFLAEHWPGVQAAWRYVRSLLDPRTGQPTIPAGKEGQNEQAQLADDVRLSSAWIDAADAMADLQRRRGANVDAAATAALAARARRSLAANGWDAGRRFWIEGHTLSGEPVAEDRSDAIGLLAQGVFTPSMVDAALDHLSTPAFRTDWGERSLSAASPGYDPNAYSQGAVWGLGTSAAARAFWQENRPLVAWGLLDGLSSWNTLDSPGRLHEVLAGDLYHPELESVPEQTWSSAGLLLGAVQGLLGLKVEGGEHRLTFRPALPGEWNGAEVQGVRVADARLDLKVSRRPDRMVLEVDDTGPPVSVDFAPELPLGAADILADVGGRAWAVRSEPHPQDLRARLRFTAAPGRTQVTIRYAGGVRVVPVTIPPQPGDASRNLQVESAQMQDDRLDLRADVADPARAQVALLTPLQVLSVSGGTIRSEGEGRLVLTLTPTPGVAAGSGGYRPAHAQIRFAPPPAQARSG